MKFDKLILFIKLICTSNIYHCHLRRWGGSKTKPTLINILFFRNDIGTCSFHWCTRFIRERLRNERCSRITAEGELNPVFACRAETVNSLVHMEEECAFTHRIYSRYNYNSDRSLWSVCLVFFPFWGNVRILVFFLHMKAFLLFCLAAWR